MAVTDFLLTTKLYFPTRRSKLVTRTRLVDLLNEGLTRPLTLVSAPAGFGKTTLLTEWHDSPEGKDFLIAWVTLDSDDNDPSRFLLYLAAACASLKKGVGKTALASLQLQPPPPINTILTSLVNDLNDLSGQFALVLDDYHLISAQPVHAILKFLLDHLPAAVHLVLLTRTDPPLPLARLRARDQLTEIRLEGLRFQPEEAARFLNETMELDLSAGDITALESRTEGWIAGLKLAAVSLTQQTDKHAFVAAFAGDDRYIMDYLLEEVLQHQPAELQAFLLKTSFLERMSGPLCQAVTGDPDSQATLEKLEQTNLFVTSLDNRRFWYRYHPLFADLLRHRLHRSYATPDWKELVQRACGWYEQEGLIVEAISQAFATGDHKLAADMLERHVLTVFFRSETLLVHHWLKALPEPVIQERALLCAVFAHTIAHTGNFQAEPLQQMQRWLGAADQALAATGPGRDEPLTRSFLALSRAYLALWRFDPAQTVIDLARQALAGLPPEGLSPGDLNFLRLRSGLNNNLGISFLNLGDEESALKSFAETQRVGEACGDLLNLYTAVSNQCFILTIRGRLFEAAALCRKVLTTLTMNTGLPDRPIPYAAVVYLTLGKIQLEWNELVEAETALQKSLELSQLMASADGLLESSIALARLKRARGDLAGAFDLLDRFEAGSNQTKVRVADQRARLYLANGDVPAAERTLEASGLRADDKLTYWKEQDHITLSRLLIAQDKLAKAEALLLRLTGAARGSGHNGRLIEILNLRAMALQTMGKGAAALELLDSSLEQAEPEGYLQVFIEEGQPMVKLLTQAEKKGEHARYARKILDAISAHASGTSYPSTIQAMPSKLIAPLSNREIEVLRLLASGLTNKEIAHKLYISVRTVKYHTTSIYIKLEVKGRAHAAVRARELGLLN